MAKTKSGFTIEDLEATIAEEKAYLLRMESARATPKELDRIRAKIKGWEELLEDCLATQ